MKTIKCPCGKKVNKDYSNIRTITEDRDIPCGPIIYDKSGGGGSSQIYNVVKENNNYFSFVCLDCGQEHLEKCKESIKL